MWVIFLFHFETGSAIQGSLDLYGQSSCQNAVVTGVSNQAQQFRLPLTCYFSNVLSLFALINRLFIINIYEKAFSTNSNLLPNLTNHECSTFPNFDLFYDSNSQHLQHWETVPESAPTASVSNSSNKLQTPSLLAAIANNGTLSYTSLASHIIDLQWLGSKEIFPQEFHITT